MRRKGRKIKKTRKSKEIIKMEKEEKNKYEIKYRKRKLE